MVRQKVDLIPAGARATPHPTAFQDKKFAITAGEHRHPVRTFLD
jgi:hypothetical protein